MRQGCREDTKYIFSVTLPNKDKPICIMLCNHGAHKYHGPNKENGN